MKKYGETEKEKEAESTKKCHEIVKTINEFGVTNDQKRKIIYLLALELEEHELMQELTTMIKTYENASFKKTTLII